VDQRQLLGDSLRCVVGQAWQRIGELGRLGAGLADKVREIAGRFVDLDDVGLIGLILTRDRVLQHWFACSNSGAGQSSAPYTHARTHAPSATHCRASIQ